MSKTEGASSRRQGRPAVGGPENVQNSERVKRRRAAVGELEKEPLRRRILAHLAASPTSPGDLAKQLEAAGPSVSRLLAEFRTEGLVFATDDEADRRRVAYALTEAGEAALNRHFAFGARRRPKPKIKQERRVALTRVALDRAVRIRREANRLPESTERLRGVLREAEKIGAHDIALEAMAELAKTARQNRQPEDQEAVGVCFEEIISRLNDIALGNDPAYEAEFAIPAAAHLKYNLGRAGERRGDDLHTREAHLNVACSLYGQLVKNSAMPASTEWFGRRAWSVISLAGNLRKQTELEKALSYATIAKRSFDYLEDEYGRAQCFFMFGFCLRLLGEFREASSCLDRAYEIADRNAFQRARADTLMQMGEVRRCLGALDESRTLLNEALEQADGMDLLVTQAFALSALGAVEFQSEDFGASREYLTRAGTLFDGCSHIEGKALNARREAAVARQIASESSKPNYAAIERLIDSAFEGYKGLHSPAGKAACAIEEGRVRMLRKGGRVSPAVERLNVMLSSPGQRAILELDPWVPLLLNRFAQEVDDGPLLTESERVLSEAQKVLAERGTQSVKQVASVVEGMKIEAEDEIAPSAAEMGGEARRDPRAFEALPLSEPEQELQAA